MAGVFVGEFSQDKNSQDFLPSGFNVRNYPTGNIANGFSRQFFAPFFRAKNCWLTPPPHSLLLFLDSNKHTTFTCFPLSPRVECAATSRTKASPVSFPLHAHHLCHHLPAAASPLARLLRSSSGSLPSTPSSLLRLQPTRTSASAASEDLADSAVCAASSSRVHQRVRARDRGENPDSVLWHAMHGYLVWRKFHVCDQGQL